MTQEEIDAMRAEAEAELLEMARLRTVPVETHDEFGGTNGNLIPGCLR